MTWPPPLSRAAPRGSVGRDEGETRTGSTYVGGLTGADRGSLRETGDANLRLRRASLHRPDADRRSQDDDETRDREHRANPAAEYLFDVERSLLESTVNEAHLLEALATRTVIGQAVGLLMAQEGLTADEAFQKLVGVSQGANTKLRDIAQRYVDAWEDRCKRADGPGA